MSDYSIARRTVIAGAGAGLVSGLVSEASAQGAKPEIQASEYWANKGDVKLYLYRKRARAAAGRDAAGAVPGARLVEFLALELRPQRSRQGEYSLMNVMAGYGFDVWTMDHDGYGRSGSSGNNSDIASGVEDLKAAIPVVVQESGQQKAAHVRHLVGRDPRRRLRAGGARARRPADPLGLHLQGHRLARDRAAQCGRGPLSRQSAPQARRLR